MARHILTLSYTLLFAISAIPGHAQVQVSELDKTIRDHVKKHDFSGTILVQDQGKEIYHKSFGLADREFDVLITNETKYRIASITKAFTAVLVLQLFEEGKLDLHGTIKTYLPNYTGEGAEQVTIHHLLNHTSGIQNIDTVKTYQEAVSNGIEHYQKPLTTEILMSKYCSGKLVHKVGKVFDYNNGDYIILGKIIEKLTGKTYEEILKQRILDPLKMSESGMLYQRNIVKNLAKTYFREGDTKPLINDLPVYIENWYAAGAMYSTTADLLKFSNAIYGARLLKPETLSLMLKPGLDKYGYGLWIPNIKIGGKQHRAAQRPGSVMGANTVLLRFLDKDLTIIILSNTNTTDIDAFSFLIGRNLIK
jgi:D-alanyl-D-alanine carboxypeptidase